MLNSTAYPREITVFAAICAIIFCILGVLDNSITIVALLRSVKLRSHATTAFVISLCISDLLFCSVNLPLTAIRYIYEAWTLGDVLCKIFPVIFYGNVAVSLLNMVAITLNRYVLISCFSYYSRIYSTALIWTQLICAWGVAFLIMLPPLLGIWGQLGLNPNTFSCTILDKDGSSPKKLIFLVGFALPMIVIIASYTCIYWKVKNSRDKVLSHDSVQGRQTTLKRTSNKEHDDRRLTRMMLVIFICFVICFLPLMIVNVFLDDLEYPSISTCASIMAWLSSVINPFIYAASNRQYRTAYIDLFKICIKGKNSVPQESRIIPSGNSLKSNIADAKHNHSKEESRSIQKHSFAEL